MELNISSEIQKEETFTRVAKFITDHGFNIETKDSKRPWGGFFKIKESDTPAFIRTFFNDVPTSKVKATEKLSPKILVVEPEKRLSWQYHHRRSEIWKVIGGAVKVVISDTDIQNEPEIKRLHDVIILKQGERHRLIGDKNWGIVAEIWQHTDSENPSNEDDIVRVEDDFGR